MPNNDEGASAPTKSSIRGGILGAAHAPRTETVPFFGEQIELRQPKLKDILAFQKAGAQDVGDMLILYAYVPGTNDRVFDETDRDALNELPFGPEMAMVVEAVTRLTSLNFQPPNPGSSETPST